MSKCDNCTNFMVKGEDEQCTAKNQFSDFSCFRPLSHGHPQRPSRAFSFEDNQTLVALALPAQKALQDPRQDPNSALTGQVTIFSYMQPIMVIGRRSLMTLRHAIDYALDIPLEEGTK